jgi:hypothetical protein
MDRLVASYSRVGAFFLVTVAIVVFVSHVCALSDARATLVDTSAHKAGSSPDAGDAHAACCQVTTPKDGLASPPGLGAPAGELATGPAQTPGRSRPSLAATSAIRLEVERPPRFLLHAALLI